MAGLLARLKAFAVAEDEAANALGGGSPRETISGTFGRALGLYGGRRRWWGPLAVTMIDGMPWFGRGHCVAQAALEAARRPS